MGCDKIRAMKRLLIVASAASFLVLPLSAQDWKGMGRLFGRVMDSSGKPIEGASVKLDSPSRGGGTTVTTDKKGNWAYQGLVACTWSVEIKADGFSPLTAHVAMSSEQARMAPLDVKLDKPKGPPPELVEALKVGDAAFAAGSWAEARTAYDKVAVIRPDLAPKLYPRFARIYAAEKNTEKALEYLQKSIDEDPSNQQLRLVAASSAIDAGMADKALEFLAAVDDTKVSGPDAYYDLGVGFLRKNDAENAVTYFTKAIAKDPKIVEAYYWRGISYVQARKLPEAKADMERVVALEPSGPTGDKAKKALEQLK